MSIVDAENQVDHLDVVVPANRPVGVRRRDLKWVVAVFQALEAHQQPISWVVAEISLDDRIREQVDRSDERPVVILRPDLLLNALQRRDAQIAGHAPHGAGYVKSYCL